jgi:hypothetical protein
LHEELHHERQREHDELGEIIDQPQRKQQQEQPIFGKPERQARLEQSSENMSRTFGCKSLIVLEWVLGGEKV